MTLKDSNVYSLIYSNLQSVYSFITYSNFLIQETMVTRGVVTTEVCELKLIHSSLVNQSDILICFFIIIFLF